MDILLFVFFLGLLTISLPGIICVPIIKKFNQTWVLPVMLLVWLVLFFVLSYVSRDYILPMFVERIVTEEVVCEPVTKYNHRWK